MATRWGNWAKLFFNNKGVDVTAADSAKFIHDQLVLDSTTQQAYQFLGGALRLYCPDKLPILAQAAQ